MENSLFAVFPEVYLKYDDPGNPNIVKRHQVIKWIWPHLLAYVVVFYRTIFKWTTTIGIFRADIWTPACSAIFWKRANEIRLVKGRLVKSRPVISKEQNKNYLQSISKFLSPKFRFSELSFKTRSQVLGWMEAWLGPAKKEAERRLGRGGGSPPAPSLSHISLFSTRSKRTETLAIQALLEGTESSKFFQWYSS